MKRAIVFDADDTLWTTESLYDSALDDTQREVERLGLDGDLWRKYQREIDLEQVRQLGFAPQRFPTSSVQAFRLLSPSHDAEAEDRVYRLSASVFRRKAELMPQVVEILSILSPKYRLGLLTKGDRTIQHQRIRQSGLIHYFQAIAIVQQKSVETFRAICHLLSVPYSLTVSVGNSLEWDIIPAVECGLHGVWIERPTWQYESGTRLQVPDGVTRLESLDGLPLALAKVAPLDMIS